MKRHINYYFLALTFTLTTCGILFLATLSAPESLRIFGNTNYYFFHQLIAILIGLVAGTILLIVPLHLIRKFTPLAFFLNIIFMGLVFIPGIGAKFGGATRWIHVGPVLFQPAEFLKITSILFISALISARFNEGTRKGLSQFSKKSYEDIIRVYLPFIISLLTLAGMLIFQRDMSTLGIITISLLTIYFLSGTPLWHTLLSLTIMISGAVLFIVSEPYRLKRFLVFLNPLTDPQGIGFHVNQSLISIGSGGWFGNGLGMSTQKFGFLPEAMSDSIFAIVGEELGFIGCAVLIGLFVYFLWLGIKIAISANDKFSRFTTIGISTWIIVQAFINIMSSMGMFPLAGIPLPFFSYGGSHIVIELIGAGLLLNISKNG